MRPVRRVNVLKALMSLNPPLWIFRLSFCVALICEKKKKERNLHYKAAFPHRAALYNLKIA